MYTVVQTPLYNLYMKQMPSTEFRLVYASLTETVKVTVHGRTIGTWHPAKDGTERGQPEERDSFTEFRPVPKTAKKKK